MKLWWAADKPGHKPTIPGEINGVGLPPQWRGVGRVVVGHALKGGRAGGAAITYKLSYTLGGSGQKISGECISRTGRTAEAAAA
jgi:hypothetical protein